MGSGACTHGLHGNCYICDGPNLANPNAAPTQVVPPMCNHSAGLSCAACTPVYYSGAANVYYGSGTVTSTGSIGGAQLGGGGATYNPYQGIGENDIELVLSLNTQDHKVSLRNNYQEQRIIVPKNARSIDARKLHEIALKAVKDYIDNDGKQEPEEPKEYY